MSQRAAMRNDEGLRVRGVTVRFGGRAVVDDASLWARPGTVTGLAGPVGAGKTTLLDVLAGVRRPTLGTVRLDGADLTRAAPRERARRGIARASRGAGAPAGRTVREAVRQAAERHARIRPVPGRTARDRWHRRRAARRASVEVADALLERVGLAGHADRPVSTVPPGVGRLLTLAGALATEPRVVLLDEPFADLTVEETRALEVLLRELAAEGPAILLAEPDVDTVVGVSDELYVLDSGRLVASGPPFQVRADLRTASRH
jgi:branched-chain amino acid transport system ATP-binding protein